MKKSLILFFLIWSISFPGSAAEPVRLAAILAKTGIAAVSNASYLSMVEPAVEEINTRGGLLGHPVELLILDNKSTPIGSKQAAEEAVQLQVTAVIGAVWSGHSLAAAPILQKAGIPMISPVSTHPDLTRIGNYIFRVCFTDAFQGKIMARFAYNELRAGTAVILTIINEEYSLILGKFFADSFKKHGGKILMETGYTGKAVDFKNILEKVKTLGPDVVFIPGYERDSGLLIRQAHSMGIRTVFLGGDGWSDKIYDYGGSAADGNYYSTHWHPDIPSASNIRLKNLFRARYGTEIPDTGAPLEYDAFMLLADAVSRAGSSDRAEIRKALAETKGFQGATGSITFDENRDPLNKDAVIMKLEKGKSVYFKTFGIEK